MQKRAPGTAKQTGSCSEMGEAVNRHCTGQGGDEGNLDLPLTVPLFED